ITITSDGRIMYENVCTIIAPDEAVSFGIIEPLHGALHFDFPPERGLRDLAPQRPVNNPNAVRDTNRAEFIRIECPVNRPFFFIAKISLYLSGHKTDLNDSRWFTASPERETGNSRESRRWTWHRVTSRRASSSRVPCVYRHGKLFSRPL